LGLVPRFQQRKKRIFANVNLDQAEIGIFIAALGGLAVGLERERSGHASGPQARFAGVRTFTLLGILSGVAGWLWIRQSQPFAVVLLAGAVGLVVAAYAAASRHEQDATTEVAALVVLAAGVAAGIGFRALAGGLIAVTTLLLIEKSRIHDFARRLDDKSLRAAVRFGVMAIVILPLLPEGPFGPGAGLSPRTLWLAVLIFSGLSFAGYLARKALTGTAGYPVAGMLGGLMSSTAVTFTFSRLSRSQPSQNQSLAVGVVGASTILFVRVLVATTTLNPGLARTAIRYFALPFLAGAVVTIVGWYRNNDSVEPEREIANPLQFWNSLQMAVLFQAVLYLVHWLDQRFGNQGLLVSGAILGLTDVDALTISMARGVRTEDWNVAAQALSLGILSNTALKAAVAIALGKGRFRWFAASGLIVIGAAVTVSLYVAW
jgi:uncharacterized membrane protein (DUF4010 family)